MHVSTPALLTLLTASLLSSSTVRRQASHSNADAVALIGRVKATLGGTSGMSLKRLAAEATCSGPDGPFVTEVLLFYGFDLTEGDERRFRYDYRSLRPNTVSGVQFADPEREDTQGKGIELSPFVL